MRRQTGRRRESIGVSIPATTTYVAVLPSRHPSHSDVVSGPSVEVPGGPAQPIAAVHLASEPAIDWKATRETVSVPIPPSMGWFVSASPWIASRVAPALPGQSEASSDPATGPAARTMSGRSQPNRNAIIAPFENPVTKTRFSSTGNTRSVSSMSAARKPTSSTSLRAALPQQAPASHVRPSPSGWRTTSPSRAASSSKPLTRANWSPLPSPPCSASTSGHPLSGGSLSGTNCRYVRSIPSWTSDRWVTPGTTTMPGSSSSSLSRHAPAKAPYTATSATTASADGLMPPSVPRPCYA